MAQTAALDADENLASLRFGRVDDGLAQRRIELDEGLANHARHHVFS
jgi:hypothetical protein